MNLPDGSTYCSELTWENGSAHFTERHGKVVVHIAPKESGGAAVKAVHVDLK
jgi:hypothetical protein